MTLLAAGLLLFTGAHLFPAVAKASRDSLVGRLGENAYRGTFSLVVVVSLLMIVFGWRSATPMHVYVPPLAGGAVTSILVFAGFVFFFGAQTKTNIKRFVRHPQMVGVLFWSLAHLLANGDSRSVLLFGSMGAWAILEIVFCNRRDGEWEKPGPSPLKWDLITVGLGATAFVVLALLHETLFNVPPHMG